MKRILSLLLAITLVFVLSACRSERSASKIDVGSIQTENNTDEGAMNDAEVSNDSMSTPSTSHNTSKPISSTINSQVSKNEPSSSEDINEQIITNILSTITQDTESDNTSEIEERERQIFVQLYEYEKKQYLLNIAKQINSLNAELNEWGEKATNNSVEYERAKALLMERYANMGLLNSGAYQAALSSLEQNYRTNNDECSEMIRSIGASIIQLKEEQNNPDTNNILAQLATNNNMTFYEAAEKYEKYIVNS